MFVNAFASPTGSVTAKANVFAVPNSASATSPPLRPVRPSRSGHTATVTLNWTGLAAGHFLGVVSYSDGTSPIGSTIVDVTS